MKKRNKMFYFLFLMNMIKTRVYQTKHLINKSAISSGGNKKSQNIPRLPQRKMCLYAENIIYIK